MVNTNESLLTYNILKYNITSNIFEITVHNCICIIFDSSIAYHKYNKTMSHFRFKCLFFGIKLWCVCNRHCMHSIYIYYPRIYLVYIYIYIYFDWILSIFVIFHNFFFAFQSFFDRYVCTHIYIHTYRHTKREREREKEKAKVIKKNYMYN